MTQITDRPLRWRCADPHIQHWFRSPTNQGQMVVIEVSGVPIETDQCHGSQLLFRRVTDTSRPLGQQVQYDRIIAVTEESRAAAESVLRLPDSRIVRDEVLIERFAASIHWPDVVSIGRWGVRAIAQEILATA